MSIGNFVLTALLIVIAIDVGQVNGYIYLHLYVFIERVQQDAPVIPQIWHTKSPADRLLFCIFFCILFLFCVCVVLARFKSFQFAH